MTTHADETTRETKWDRHFQTDHLKEDLRGRSVRGGTITLAAQGARFVLGLGATAVLARQLSPADFGLVGMVLAVVGFVTLFRTMGLSAATVQRANVSHDQVSTLFWLNAALGLAVFFAVAALSPGIAWFYGEPKLVSITLALGFASLFTGLSAQHAALLSRQMRFTAGAAISVISMLAGVLLAVGAALLGAGYWSLVIQRLAESFTETVAVWTLCRWRPGLPRRNCGVRSMVFFGGSLTASNLVHYSSRNLDNLLIGWRWGAGSLGIYAKAYSLLLLPASQFTAPISAVTIPALSRLQNTPDRYHAYYTKALGLMATIGMPAICFLFVVADLAVRTILGSQWMEAVPVFRALAPAAFLSTFTGTLSWVYISLGRTNRMFKWGLFSSIVSVSAFVLGLPWGPLGVATAYSLSTLVLAYPAVAYCFAGSPLRPWSLISVLLPAAFACAMACGITALVGRHYEPADSAPWALLYCFVIFSLAYVGSLCAMPSGRAVLAQLLSLSRAFSIPYSKKSPDTVSGTTTS